MCPRSNLAHIFERKERFAVPRIISYLFDEYKINWKIKIHPGCYSAARLHSTDCTAAGTATAYRASAVAAVNKCQHQHTYTASTADSRVVGQLKWSTMNTSRTALQSGILNLEVADLSTLDWCGLISPIARCLRVIHQIHLFVRTTILVVIKVNLGPSLAIII